MFVVDLLLFVRLLNKREEGDGNEVPSVIPSQNALQLKGRYANAKRCTTQKVLT